MPWVVYLMRAARALPWCVVLGAGAAAAQPPPAQAWQRMTPEQRREQWQALPSEQKTQLWKELTPEQRMQAWERLSPEQRMQMRDGFTREQREAWRRHREERADGEGPADRPLYRHLTPEERQRLREQIRDAHKDLAPRPLSPSPSSPPPSP